MHKHDQTLGRLNGSHCFQPIPQALVPLSHLPCISPLRPSLVPPFRPARSFSRPPSPPGPRASPSPPSHSLTSSPSYSFASSSPSQSSPPESCQSSPPPLPYPLTPPLPSSLTRISCPPCPPSPRPPRLHPPHALNAPTLPLSPHLCPLPGRCCARGSPEGEGEGAKLKQEGERGGECERVRQRE